jgi:hypothetical protein
VHEEIEQDEGPMDQSEEEGEDLVESAERDYQPMDVPLCLCRNSTTTNAKAQTSSTTTSTPRLADWPKRSSTSATKRRERWMRI